MRQTKIVRETKRQEDREKRDVKGEKELKKEIQINKGTVWRQEMKIESRKGRNSCLGAEKGGSSECFHHFQFPSYRNRN